MTMDTLNSPSLGSPAPDSPAPVSPTLDCTAQASPALDSPTLCDAVRALGPGVSVSYPRTGERLDAAGLETASERFAHRLVEAGVRPGDVVGLLSPTGPQVLVGLLGIVRSGAAASMLPTTAGTPEREAERLAPAVGAAGMRHLVVHRDCADTARALHGLHPALTVVDTESSPSRSPVGRLPRVAPEDLAVVQFTSGSTSAPKGVMLSHATVLAGLRAIAASARMGGDDVMVTWVPHFHDMGLFGPLAVLFAGGSVHVIPPLDFVRRPGRVLRLLAETGATLLTGPDFSYQRLAAAATPQVAAELDLSRWRLAFNGAEPVRSATVSAFRTRMAPAKVAASTMYPVYGMAEATLAITFPAPGTTPRVVHVDRQRLSDDGLAVEVPPGHPQAKPLVAVGRPVLGMELRLVDAAGSVCGPGQLGEIQISGPAVTSGYYGDPVATAAAFDGPWLRTGDLGLHLDGDLFVTGRRKEMIVVNGQNHFPEDAESLTRDLPGVHRGRCVAYADIAGERLTVAVEIAPGGDPDAVARQIHRTLAERLGTASVHVHPLRPGWLPLTTSGKWQRGLVRELLADKAGAAQR
ncbi:AMP-binding protein [Streptomyces sp. NPDC006530]|uniref:AMP-binding protein n=1 Tax=Streptomyces sp. NPDC006530 TaxID=3364750 RepID=UPI0036B7CE0E